MWHYHEYDIICIIRLWSHIFTMIISFYQKIPNYSTYTHAVRYHIKFRIEGLFLSPIYTTNKSQMFESSKQSLYMNIKNYLVTYIAIYSKYIGVRWVLNYYIPQDWKQWSPKKLCNLLKSKKKLEPRFNSKLMTQKPFNLIYVVPTPFTIVVYLYMIILRIFL